MCKCLIKNAFMSFAGQKNGAFTSVDIQKSGELSPAPRVISSVLPVAFGGLLALGVTSPGLGNSAPQARAEE